MNNLERVYAQKVRTAATGDLLFQVGHTEGGRAISAAQFSAMVGDLRALLELSPQDRLLDLCCGNGAVTAVLAPEVAATVGLDLVEDLVAVARRQDPGGAHVRYLQCDLRRLPALPALDEEPFSRVLLHAALQHFKPADFKPLMREILRRSRPDVVIVFGFVPEAGKQKFLFNTPRKRLYNWYLRARRRDVFGHWWSRAQLTQACAELGLSCSFHPVHDSLRASSHRFNMRIKRDLGP
jgi:ubiquinone/menaquinone biosynthesis C-methylase UbiE